MVWDLIKALNLFASQILWLVCLFVSTFHVLIELFDGTLPHSSEIYFPDSLFQLAD